LKANFKVSDSSTNTNVDSQENMPTKELTKKEFEDYMLKSGASGSFMIYRSDKKNDELGLDEL
jgi:hypothetical protein